MAEMQSWFPLPLSWQFGIEKSQLFTGRNETGWEMLDCVRGRNTDPKPDPSNPPISAQESVWKQNCDWWVGRLSLEQQQSAADGEQHCGEGGAVLARLSLQGLLVGLVRGRRALGRRHGGGREGGAAGTHVVKVSRKLRLPGLLP